MLFLVPSAILENKFLKSWENAEPWLCWKSAQNVPGGSAGPVTTWLVALNLCHCGTCWVCWMLTSPGVPVPWGFLCPQLSALVSLCSGVFVPGVPRPAQDEGNLWMAKQGREAGSHHRCTWPCPEQTATGKVGLHIWAALGSNGPHHSPKENKAVEHWAASTPFLPHSVLSIPPITKIPPHPAPSCSMAFSF